ncbi:MAG: transporter substrate-binding domain-containing protein [Spirochaetales bacterium]|nr:transporter substrate-binding domain-containing protein [Spirochaetales bacterium]
MAVPKQANAAILSDRAKSVSERLAAAGGLRIATTETVGIYERGPDGSLDGFQALLARRFADWLGVPMNVEVVDFESFFTVDGELPGARGAAARAGSRPDIFDRVDLIVHSLTDLPWRRNLILLVPVLPNRIMIITRKGEEVDSLEDLAGRRLVVMATTSYESVARTELLDRGIPVQVDTVPFGSDVYEAVRRGSSDATLRDSDTAIAPANRKSGLSISWPISGLEWTGWATAPDDPELAAVLQEFLSKSKMDGSFGRIFESYFGMSLADYYSLVRYDGTTRLSLTIPQMERIEAIRASGGLRVAIDEAPSVYEPAPAGASGTPGGFHYALLERFARELRLELKVTPVRFEEFFALDGAIPERAISDPSYHYVPDLLRVSDLYVGPLSPLDWRKRFLRFSELFPTSLVYVARAGLEIKDPGALEGLDIALIPGTSHEAWFLEREEELGTRFRTVRVGTAEGAVLAVVEGKVDLTLADASFALAVVQGVAGRAQLSPASSELEPLAWAVAREDDGLGGALDLWIEMAKTDGTFESLWTTCYGIQFTEYLSMLDPER